jgi:hypothetical protein
MTFCGDAAIQELLPKLFCVGACNARFVGEPAAYIQLTFGIYNAS